MGARSAGTNLSMRCCTYQHVDPPKRSTTAFFMNFDDNSAVIYCYGGRIDAEPTGRSGCLDNFLRVTDGVMLVVLPCVPSRVECDARWVYTQPNRRCAVPVPNGRNWRGSIRSRRDRYPPLRGSGYPLKSFVSTTSSQTQCALGSIPYDQFTRNPPKRFLNS